MPEGSVFFNCIAGIGGDVCGAAARIGAVQVDLDQEWQPNSTGLPAGTVTSNARKTRVSQKGGV